MASPEWQGQQGRMAGDDGQQLPLPSLPYSPPPPASAGNAGTPLPGGRNDNTSAARNAVDGRPSQDLHQRYSQQQAGMAMSMGTEAHGHSDPRMLTPPSYFPADVSYQHHVDYAPHDLYAGQSLRSMYYAGGSPSYAAYHPSPAPTYSPAYDAPVQHMQRPLAAPALPNKELRSPRQQFTDSLRRGVQSFTFTPAGASAEHRGQDGLAWQSTTPLPASSALPYGGALPARPDSAIRAAQMGQMSSEAGSSAPGTWNEGPRVGMAGHSSGTPTAFAATTVGPPPRAPTVPLSSRFPPLPSKPSMPDIVSMSKEEMQKQYEAREEALLLRVEALGFEPEAAWEVMKEASVCQGGDEGEGQSKGGEADKQGRQTEREVPAPILGIRLLQRLELLQRENEELHEIFAKKMTGQDESELQDALRLIQSLDRALTASAKRVEEAEARAEGIERALAVACAQNSSSITAAPTAPGPSPPPPWKSSPVRSRKE